MCDKAVDTCPFVFDSVPDWYNSQELFDKAILENGGTLVSIPTCYKNKKYSTKLLIIIHMH